mmetsp:Transcript_25832/g.75706  ORF Transcript_25832/g.75706 Transcript_25832/m.75706 type:complete len:252 (-) Transcript_25832:587-1342(-)
MSGKLKVEPSHDIAFEVSGGKANSCPLRLYNSGTEHTAFKVKTTAPKKYCVRPNAGVIPPGKHVEVHVIPQVVKGAESTLTSDLAGKCKDKFMIQSTTTQGDQPLTSEAWASVPQGELQQTLLRCKYKAALSEGAGSSIPEGEVSLGSYAAVKSINVAELDFSDTEGVKARITEMNKEIQSQSTASARKLNQLQEENLKLSAQLSNSTSARGGSVTAGGSSAQGYSTLLVILVAIISYVLGVYTFGMTLPK